MSIEDTLQMPKTAKEQLDELEIGKSILVGEQFTRNTLANLICIFHKETDKVFSIRTSKTDKSEVRVWRLK